jgi:hypothetical protein
MADFFKSVRLDQVQLDEVTLRVRHGSSSPPVLLLHGHPRTHTTGHRVAPLLARKRTVVCAESARLRQVIQAKGPAAGHAAGASMAAPLSNSSDERGSAEPLPAVTSAAAP